MSTARTFAEAISSLEKEIGAEKAVEAAVLFLKERSALTLLPSIMGGLEKLRKREKDLSSVSIETSHEVPKEIIEGIRAYVQAEERAAVEHHINNDLIGGFRAEYRGKRFDGSARGMIQRLKHELLS